MQIPPRHFKRLEALEQSQAQRLAARLQREESACLAELRSTLLGLTEEQADALRRGADLTPYEKLLQSFLQQWKKMAGTCSEKNRGGGEKANIVCICLGRATRRPRVARRPAQGDCRDSRLLASLCRTAQAGLQMAPLLDALSINPD